MKYIKLIRVKHWVKNFLIFLPIIFGRDLFKKENYFEYFLSFFAFCFIASAVYIINDLKDIEKDRQHPVKKNRALASGVIKKEQAHVLLVFLIIGSGLLVSLSGNLTVATLSCLIGYLVLNIIYSFGLKDVPILDVVILSSGFVIRAIYGGFIADIEISSWLYLTVTSMSLFMALGKRRNEMTNNSQNTRKVLEYYDIDFLDKFMYLCLSITIMFYALWSMDSNIVNKFGNNLLFTVPIIIVICMKYCLTIESNAKKHKDGDPTDILFSDKLLGGLIFIYILAILLIIY